MIFGIGLALAIASFSWLLSLFSKMPHGPYKEVIERMPPSHKPKQILAFLGTLLGMLVMACSLLVFLIRTLP